MLFWCFTKHLQPHTPASRWSTLTGVPVLVSCSFEASPSARRLLPPPRHLSVGLVRHENEDEVEGEDEGEEDQDCDCDQYQDEGTWHWIVLVAKVVDHWVPMQGRHVRLVTVTWLGLFPAQHHHHIHHGNFLGGHQQMTHPPNRFCTQSHRHHGHICHSGRCHLIMDIFYSSPL